MRPLAWLALLAALPGPGLAAEVAVRRYALVIGANDGGPNRIRLQYALRDAAAFAAVLRELGGVAAEDETLLLEPSRAALHATLEALRVRLAAVRDARTELLVYYSGHSDEEGLLLGGERFAYAELREALRQMPADVRVGVLDSCASGALTRAKGGVLRPPFLLDESTQVTGHAFLTSSSADEAAQESDTLGGSFFTHYLISGLRGAADTTGDGRVTLNESYQFAFAETLARTEKTQGGAQHPSYDIQLAGTGDLVLTDLRVANAGLELGEGLAGRVFVRNTGGQLVAELNKPAGRRVTLGLEPGAYEVTVRGAQGLFAARVAIGTNARPVLESEALTPLSSEPTVSRGGPPALAHEPVRVTLLPALYPSQPVRSELLLGLLVGNATELNGMALSLGVNAIAARADGFVLAFGLNLIGGDLFGIAWTSGANVIAGRSRGLGVAAGANIADGDVELLQLAGGLNVAGANLDGAQLAGGLNIAGGEVDGLMLAGGFNLAGGALRGAQLSAGFNRAGDTRGLQVAALNLAGDLRGLQLGLVNVAGVVHGVQLGLVNVAEDIHGLPIGLVNWVERGQRHLAYWASPQEYVNLDFRFGSRHVYTLLMAGFESEAQPNRWYAAFGFGATARFDPLFLNVDLSAGANRRGFRAEPQANVRAQLRLMLGVELLSHLSLFVGGSLGAFAGWDGEDMRIPGAPQIVHSERDHVQRYWPSFFAGVQI